MNTKLPLLLGIFALSLIVPAGAQTLYWDGNGSSSGAGNSPSGIWDAINVWNFSSEGTDEPGAWTPGATAVFSAGTDATEAFTVTLNSLQLAGGITFQEGNVTLTGASLQLDNFPAPAISVGTDLTSEIQSQLDGFSGIAKTGSGTLILSGANTYFGGTTLSAGAIAFGSDAALGQDSLTMNVSSGMIRAEGGARTVTNNLVLNQTSTIGGVEPLTLAGPVLLSGTVGQRRIIVTNSEVTIISGVISGADPGHALRKEGTNVLVLSGDNAYEGGTSLNAGTLGLGHDNALGTGQILLSTAGSTLRADDGARTIVNTLIYGQSLTIGGSNDLTWIGPVVITNVNRTMTVTNTGVTTIASDIVQELGTASPPDGLLRLTKAGAGILVLLGNNGHGGTTLSAGTLGIGHENSLGTGVFTNSGGTLRAENGAITIPNAMVLNGNTIWGGTNGLTVVGQITLNGNRTVTVTNSGTTFASNIQEDQAGRRLTKAGTGTLFLPEFNSHSDTTLSAGILAIGHDNALGTGVFTNTAGTLRAEGGAKTIPNTMVLNGNTTWGGTNGLTVAGQITLNGNRTVTVTNSGTVFFNGIQEDQEGRALTKAGVGNLFLDSASTYSGQTTVNAGTLVVRNNSGSATGSGDVTAAANGTLSGSGIVAGKVAGAGKIAPGNSVGTLTVGGGLDLSSGGTLVWELGANSTNNPGTDFDQLIINGGDLVLGGSSKLSIQFTNSATAPDAGNPFWQSVRAWKIISLTGAAANLSSATFVTLQNASYAAGNFTVAAINGEIWLRFSPPAPQIQSQIVGAGTANATLSWSAQNGQSYRVEYKDDLNDPMWTVLDTVNATSATASFSDTTGPVLQRFYQVVIP